MSHEKWRTMFLLLTFAFSNVSGSFVGINIGTDISNMPSAANVVSILQAQQISHVRLFDADRQLLNALANTGIEVMVSVPNDQLLGIGESRTAAASWISRNVATYLPATNITAIAVGSEVLTTIPNAALVLVPAMKFLHAGLVASNLDSQVKISTPHAMDIIPKPFPPFSATFNSSLAPILLQLLRFLQETNSFFMLNAHPYYGYTNGNGIFPLDYALFRPLPLIKQVVDPNTLFHYVSMLDTMVDAAYYSMEALNFTRILVLVTESGWPWLGGPNEPDATIDNAVTFNTNLIRRVLNNSGTPSRPDMPVSAYIYELFNEDLRPGPVSEKNWGVFYPNGTSVYSLSISSVSRQTTGNSSGAGLFCVALTGADENKLKDGLDWACGLGGANCTAIQVGGACYQPNTYEDHASYAYNDYYQKARSSGATCDFGGSATTTSINPSHGSCIFSGSSNSSTGGGGGFVPFPALGPISPDNTASQIQIYGAIFLVPVIVLALV